MKINCPRLSLAFLLLLTFLLPGALATGRAGTAKPILSFTNLKTGQRLSNDVFTVQGNTTSTLGVSNVLYKFTDVWTNAIPASTNNWTNWSAQINLTPGTNTLAAYAVDNSGNRSLTNTVKFVYVVFTKLIVNTNGNGTVTPNYNGQLLQIGETYSMTAKSPISGFGLQNWTDGSNNVVTNGATLKFFMASNLVFTANFGDVTKPTVKVTSVSTNASPGSLTVNGTASDNVAVTNVIYSLNNAAWTNASPANGWSNWTAQVTLTPGSNTVAVCAVDSSGILSVTNTVKYFYVVLATLTVHTNGIGTLTPNYNGAQLKIGAPYSMTAKAPGRGFGLRTWTDGSNNIVSTASTLKFIMTSNLTLTANFGDVAPPVINARSTSTNSDGILNDYFLHGVASDNVGVSNVYYQLSTTANWSSTAWTNATSANNWTNWTASLSLKPGLNYFFAYAVDVNSNACPVYEAEINYNSAPLHLSGQYAVATDSSGKNLFTVGFGKSTFSEATRDANNINGVGTYSYFPSGAYANLKYKYTCPPTAASKGSHAYSLVFYTPNYATFSTTNIVATNLVVITTNLVYVTNNTVISTNVDYSTNTVATNLVNYVSGTMKFSSVSNLVFSNPSGQLIWSVGSQGDGVGTLFSNRNYFAQTLLTNDSNAGTYTYTAYSPVGSLFKLTDTNGTSYVVTSFADTNYGSYYAEDYDQSNHINGTDNGHFVVASTNPVVNAPLTLTNQNLHVFSGADDFNVQFGDSTYSQDSATTNFDNDVGSYTYAKADTTIGQLNLTVIAPPTDAASNVLAGTTSAARLIFVGGNVGLFTNEDNTFSAFALTSVTNLALADISTNTLSLTYVYYLYGIFREYGTNQFQFDTNGNFSFNSTNNTPSGTYSYTAFSPTVAMMQLNFLTNGVGTNGTEIDWVRLNFGTTNSGSYSTSQFDTETNYLNKYSGPFLIQ